MAPRPEHDELGLPLRASDADRQRAVAQLAAHAGEGRLTLLELEDRIDEVHRAVSLRDVRLALRELPAVPDHRSRSRGRRPLRGAERRIASFVGAGLLVVAVLGLALPEPTTHYLESGAAVVTSESVPAPSPPPLPPPGLEQPAEPEAARAGVAQAYVQAFAPHPDPAVKESAVVRTPGMAAAGRTVVESYPEAVATTTVSTGEIVFTSPTEAAVRFQLHYSGGAPMGPRIGYAVWDAGRWKVASTTFCDVLAFGGGVC